MGTIQGAWVIPRLRLVVSRKVFKDQASGTRAKHAGLTKARKMLRHGNRTGGVKARPTAPQRQAVGCSGGRVTPAEVPFNTPWRMRSTPARPMFAQRHGQKPRCFLRCAAGHQSRQPNPPAGCGNRHQTPENWTPCEQPVDNLASAGGVDFDRKISMPDKDLQRVLRALRMLLIALKLSVLGI